MAIVLRSEKGSALTHTEHDNNFTELDKIPNGKVFPRTAGIGIKLDTDAPEFGWHDLIGVYCAPESNPPASVPFIGTVCSKKFVEGTQIGVKFHLPHDYLPGSDIFVHIHWATNSDKITGGSVTWGFEASYAKGHQQAAYTAPKTVTVAQACDTTQYWHHIAETAMSVGGGSATQFDTNELETDGVIISRMYCDSIDLTTSDASVPDVFAEFVDIHYQSTGIPTKNRSPDFWGA